jgi:ribokinase
MAKPSIVIVGSLNFDYIAAVDRLPRDGQTVLARSLIRRFGGKGANQAIAAARQGASVSLIGCVGSEDDGHSYIARLVSERINTEGIMTTSKTLTGTALIAVERSAENTIIVAAGANGQLKPEHIRNHQRLIRSAKALLAQMEIPTKTLLETIYLANLANVPVVLNPSPLQKDFPWGRFELQGLIANVGEARAIFGLDPEQAAKKLTDWRAALLRLRVEQLFITRGSQPTIFINQSEFLEVPTLRVQPLDTVGAGDAFSGALVTHLAEGSDCVSAVRYANCAGALATLKRGAQESIPTRSATSRALRRLPER